MKRTPLRKKRPGPPRRGEPTADEKAMARMECFARARGRCEIPFPHECSGYVCLSMGQLAHLKAKRRFGWMESEVTGQRHLWACPTGHRLQHAYGWSGVKPCPPKEGRKECVATLSKEDM